VILVMHGLALVGHRVRVARIAARPTAVALERAKGDPWVLAVVATQARARLTAEITIPRSWPSVAVVEERVQVERP
jgi:hypothetical protein